MEGLGSQNELQLMSLGLGGNDYDVSQLAESNSYQNYFLGDGNDGFHYICPPLPELIQFPQNSPTYVEFLAENRVSELLGEVSHSNISSITSGCQHAVYSLDMDFKQGLHPSLQDDYSSINNCSSAEHQILTQKPHNEVSRKKTSSIDRLRKLRIAERLNALQELLPQFKEGDQATVLDDIINHINDLQGQIKDLSQNKLGGEPTCNPFISLEGHGLYLHYEQMLKRTLEEMMGKLMETNPSAAGKLLQNKGLFLMPMAIGEGLN